MCNDCKSRSGCRKERYTYYVKKANDSYKELIKSCRQGINITEEEIYNTNRVLTPIIRKGLTVNHLYINHSDILDFSKASFYNYTNSGIFDFKPSDLPRIVRYKKRTRRRTKLLKNY